MKTLFITGGHGDIGSAIVERFRKEGYRVIAPTSRQLDLSDNTSIKKYLEKFKIDSVEALIHCTGINNPARAEKMTIEEINRTLQVNTLGFFLVIKHFLPGFKKKKSGYILAISSIYSEISRAGRLSYAMSKHALNGMMKTLAIEFGPENIKINCLSPGFIDTRLTRKNNDEATIKGFEEKIPLRRLAQTKEIANVAYFLCSEENSYISGQNIIVDGGYLAGGFQK